jgi:hypothetical protein
MTDSIRVFVGGRALDLPRGATALDAVCADDTAQGAEIEAGRLAITDSRGLPLDPTTVLAAGAILRVVRNRVARSDQTRE